MRYLYLLLASFIMTEGLVAQAPLKMRDATVKGPQTFAMIVGVSKYKYIRSLTYADKDAELFRDYLKSPGGGSVKEENIFCLLNEQAININFWGKGFQWLKAKQLQRGDKLFIYLAGHGDAIDEDQFFFLGYDCNPGSDKNNYLVGGAIQLFNLKKKIANETARGVEVFFIMDACRSNELPGGTDGQNFLNTAVSEKQAGEIIMLATGAGQASLEDASIGNGHGLFTYYLVDGLNGMADSLDRPDQQVSFREIQTYVNKNVPSIAQQRFKRKQEPFFCCTESSEQIISTVDTVYLQNWLKIKKAQNRGPGNSFNGIIGRLPTPTLADTLLIETYNRFYNAVRSKNLTGQLSAEDFYRQLNTKFPGNPYTLDAQSTFAVELANRAQQWVNDYLDCREPGNREQQQIAEAGRGLEKAIPILREYDPEFANSLLGRMYLLLSFGNTADRAQHFQNARAALAIDPNGAYIHNRLAALHLENKQYDSAVYYATNANRIAPKWPCALTTLSLAQKALSKNPGQPAITPPKPRNPRRPTFGIMGGAGISEPIVNYSTENWRQGNANYNDSLSGITTSNGSRFDIGVISNIPLGNSVAIRPVIHFSYEKGDVRYERRSPVGGPTTTQVISTNYSSVNLVVPVVIHFSNKTISPYLAIGPGLTWSLQNKDDPSGRLLPVKSMGIKGDGAIGVDIGLPSAGLVLSPELRYSRVVSDIKGDGSNLYLNTISTLKKQAYVFTVYLRKR